LVKVTKSISHCPHRGQSLHQRAVGPIVTTYIMGTRTKFASAAYSALHRGPITQGVAAVGCAIADRKPLLPRRRRRLRTVHVNQPRGMSLKIPTHE
jgi:hypothetical protein